jgi:hypothetical protein
MSFGICFLGRPFFFFSIIISAAGIVDFDNSMPSLSILSFIVIVLFFLIFGFCLIVFLTFDFFPISSFSSTSSSFFPSYYYYSNISYGSDKHCWRL